jgi:hypothetical protein
VRVKIRANKGLMRWAAFNFTLISLAGLLSASASAGGFPFLSFVPGNLVVTRSVYDNNPNNVTVGQMLPPNCENTTGGCSPGATANGSYPQVWNNNLSDGSFGITSRIFLDQVTPFGFRIGSLEVPNSSQLGVSSRRNQLVTSFSSKSELAINRSLDHRFLTFMGYVSPIDALDVSNSNTPGVVDPTNPVGENVFRAVAQVDRRGRFRFTETNAYSGNNGRAAIYNDDADVFYTAGNAGNGSSPQPDGIILGAGAQIMTPESEPLFAQDPGTPTPVGSFSITQLGFKADKIGKDDNFRGLTIFNNVVYFSKGSGGNGVNTVYFIDTTGSACPNGVGLPAANASLPATAITYNLATLQTAGLPSNMCILKGFPQIPNSKATTVAFPFGLWFANATTLYVADEGDGVLADAPGETTAGLQKWVFNSTAGAWQLAYVLNAGLNIGVPYTVAGYPTGNNPATSQPWSPETDGLRNITGAVTFNRLATIYAITSTVSGNGDQGADPNKLVVITDDLQAGSLPAGESFRTLRSAGFAEVLRGVSWTPDTP